MAYPEALARAMVAGTALKLRFELSGVIFHEAASLCALELQPGAPQLWLKAPALASGKPLPVPAGARLTLSFATAGKHYGFDTDLSSTRPYPGRTSATVWVVRGPTELEAQQRRAAYRLHRWLHSPLKARLWALGAGPAALGLIEGVIEDLSATGIGVGVPRKASSGFPVGRTVGLNFRLDPDLPPIVLKGVVRSRRAKAKGDVMKLGLQFTETLRGPEDSRSIAIVMRYVTEQERLQIQHRKDQE